LISVLALKPFYKSQISIHTMAMLDFGEALMTLGFDARIMFSKSPV